MEDTRGHYFYLNISLLVNSSDFKITNLYVIFPLTSRGYFKWSIFSFKETFAVPLTILVSTREGLYNIIFICNFNQFY